MTIRSDYIAGPAHLASALVNGDTSGLDAAGLGELEAFERFISPWYVVATEGETYFTSGGETIDYVIHCVR